MIRLSAVELSVGDDGGVAVVWGSVGVKVASALAGLVTDGATAPASVGVGKGGGPVSQAANNRVKNEAVSKMGNFILLNDMWYRDSFIEVYILLFARLVTGSLRE